jgi:hypothetical protein
VYDYYIAFFETAFPYCFGAIVFLRSVYSSLIVEYDLLLGIMPALPNDNEPKSEVNLFLFGVNPLFS